MRHSNLLSSAVLLTGLWFVKPAKANVVLYNNLTPNNQMGVASRPSAGQTEIEAGDDFVLSSASQATSISFVGVIVPGTGGTPSPSQVVAEIYRVFPLDSNTGRTIAVPTRANSPSDVAFGTRDSAAAGELSFSTTTLAASFTVLNSVQSGGIHPAPTQTTGGNGPITGTEVEFDITLTSPLNLPPDHYFFVPQVSLTNGGQFYWLSASRPISGAGTTPFAPDLQEWTRDETLSPDWLRVGTDIVGGPTPPTFNGAFSISGTVPEPTGAVATIMGLAVLCRRRRAR